MANFNKVVLVGRLVDVPKFVDFERTGGRVANFSFAVTNRKFDAQKNEWVDDPMFIDCSIFNRGENGKQVDTLQRLVEERGVKKGWLLLLEGRLVQDRWEKDGQKQSKIKVIVDSYQLISEPRGEGGRSGGGDDSGYSGRSSSSGGSSAGSGSGNSRPKSSSSGNTSRKPSRDDEDMGSDDDIPF